MKSLFNTVLLREQLKRYWAVGVLTFLAYFLGCLLPLWNASSARSAASYLLQILQLQNGFILTINILAPLAAVLAIFSYMYKQSSAGVTHSLPFTKKQLFATNVLAGYILIILPLLILSVLLLVQRIAFPFTSDGSYSYYAAVSMNVFPHGLNPGDIINTVPVVCLFFLRTLLSFTFYYALFITAAVIVGNQVTYFLISAILPFLVIGFYMLFQLIALYYVFGYSTVMEPAQRLLGYTNPVILPVFFTNVVSGAPAVAAESIASFHAVHILIIAALIAVSVWLYHTRRLERAGDMVVFSPLKNFFIFLLALTGLVSLGAFLLAMFRSITAMYIGFVVGFIIAFFIAQMIAEKSFNVFYKYKSLLKHGGVALGIFAVIVTICFTDITGYARHVPDVSEISGVYFGWRSDVDYYRDNTKALDLLFIDDSGVINETLTQHERVIADRKSQRKVFLDNLSSNYRGNRIPSVKQRIIYRLKNGNLVTREYTLSEAFSNETGLNALMKSEPVLLSNVYWLNAPEDLHNIDISVSYYNYLDENMSDEEKAKYFDYPTDRHHYSTIVIYERSEIISLAEAVKKDYLLTAGKPYAEPQPGQLQFDISAASRAGSGLREWHHMNYLNGENTLAWFEANGYELTQPE